MKTDKNKTGRWTVSCLILSLLMLFYACPYESEFPLQEPSDSVWDPLLAGSWTNSEQEDIVIIYPVCGNEYLIFGCKPETNAKVSLDTGIFRAFVTEINQRSFLNLQSADLLTQEKDHYIFAEYYFREDSLVIKIIGEKLFEKSFETRAELLEFIRSNMDNDELFMDELILVKAP